jgi:hypothetical protein
LEFGLFRDSDHPLNVPVDLALAGAVGKADSFASQKLPKIP